MKRRKLWPTQVSWDAMEAALPPIDVNRVLYQLGKALGLITR